MNGYLSVIGLLRADGPVGLLIGGSGVNTARVFPGDPPQQAKYPLIAVETFDAEGFDTKSGASVLDHDMVRVSCYADTDDAARDLSTKVRAAIDERSGLYNGYYVENIRWIRWNTYDVNITNRRVRVHEADYEVRVRI